MSIFDISSARTKKTKKDLSALSDEDLKKIVDDNLGDSNAFIQDLFGVRSKKVVIQTAAFQLLREREYERREK